MTVLEFFATLCGLIYLGFISIHKRIGWLFGCVSSGIYIFLCWNQSLFIQAVLQFLYVILGVVGFLNWNKNVQMLIHRVSLKSQVAVIIFGIIFSLFLGKLMSMTNQQLPYLDATVSIFSILATLLATRSILENWLYWIFCNSLAIVLFAVQGLQITTFLYVIYLLGSFFGYHNWRKMLKIQSN